MGFELREEAVLQTLSEDILKSSEIEGELLNPQEVRSSLARRLGIEIAGLPPANLDVEGVVEMMKVMEKSPELLQINNWPERTKAGKDSIACRHSF